MTKLHGIVLIFFCTLFTSSGQLILKYGVTNNQYFAIALGLGLYGSGFLFLIHGLKHGEVMTLIPILATSFIWVVLFAHLFFQESLTILKILGSLLIVLGIITITRGGKK